MDSRREETDGHAHGEPLHPDLDGLPSSVFDVPENSARLREAILRQGDAVQSKFSTYSQISVIFNH